MKFKIIITLAINFSSYTYEWSISDWVSRVNAGKIRKSEKVLYKKTMKGAKKPIEKSDNETLGR